MITKDKEYTTRDGREVRIYATDCGGNFPIHGAVLNEGKWIIRIWAKTGSFYFSKTQSENDLIEKQKEHTVKVAFWKYNDGSIACGNIPKDSEQEWYQALNVLAIKEITFKEGEGL